MLGIILKSLKHNYLEILKKPCTAGFKFLFHPLNFQKNHKHSNSYQTPIKYVPIKYFIKKIIN